MDGNMREVYEAVLAVAVSVVLLALLVVGLVRVSLRPGTLRRYFDPRGRLIAGVMLASAVLAVAGLALASAVGQVSGTLMAGILFSLLTGIFLTAVWLPLGLEEDGEREVAPPSGVWGWVPWVLLLVLWNAAFLVVVGFVLEVDVAEGGLIEQVVPSRPILYAGFTAFAVTAAITEEATYRAGMQGLLRRTWLGAHGAIWTTAGFFALLHGGYIAQFGVKEVQILGLAAIFGYARERHGLAAAVGLHVGNNLGAMMLGLILPELP